MSIQSVSRLVLPRAVLALTLTCLLGQAALADRQEIEDPNGALLSFYKSLYRTENSVKPFITRIIHYGDSHVAADIMTGALRSKFQLGFGAESRGVIYDALGRNGARATDLLSWDWRAMADSLGRQNPRLIVIAYGSNEVGDEDLDLGEYAASFRELLARFRKAAPRASLLVISPPDRAIRADGRWQTIPRMRGLVQAQRRAALGGGAAFWNLFQAMGGAGSIERWTAAQLAQPDRVHLTRSGYKLVAQMLYEELMRGYLFGLVASFEYRERAGAATAVSSGL